MYYVIAYDVAEDARRTKIMNKLKDYGFAVQYSVFECELDAPRLQLLKDQILPLLDHATDRLHIYRICETCFLRAESYGSGGYT